MKLPADNASGHLIFEVHTYLDIEKINNTKNEVNQMIRDIKTNLVAKGAPVIFGEWGTTTKNGYEDYRSNMLTFARYFVEQAKANGMGTFYWMGLSDGDHRSVPEFNQADLKDAIIKGYYGDQGYTGVGSVTASPTTAAPAAYYTLSGQKLSVPRRGVTIVQGKDGKVRKVAR